MRIGRPGRRRPKRAEAEGPPPRPVGLGDGRAGAGGVHDQVEAGRNRSIGEGQPPLRRRHGLAPQLERDPGVEAGLVQHMEDGGAVDAQGRTRPFQIGISDVQNDPAAGGRPAEDVVDGLAQGLDLVGQAQGVEHGQARGLQHEARTHRLGLVEPFEHHDATPLTRQHQGHGQTGRPGAGDGDISRQAQLRGAGTSSIRSRLDSYCGQGRTRRQRASPMRSSTATRSRSALRP